MKRPTWRRRLLAGAIAAADGEYNDGTDEAFEIETNTSLETGDYTLNLYAASLETVAADETWPSRSYQLVITNAL